MSAQLQQAITLIKSGKRQDGQQLLLQTLKSEPENERAWLWMSTVVNENKRRYCLEKALSINPNNQQAKQVLARLAQIEAKPPSPFPATSSRSQVMPSSIDPKSSAPVSTSAQPSANDHKPSEPSLASTQSSALVTELEPSPAVAPSPQASAQPAVASEPAVRPTTSKLRTLSDLVDASAPAPPAAPPDISEPASAEDDVVDPTPRLWVDRISKLIYVTVLFEREIVTGRFGSDEIEKFQAELQRGNLPIDMLTHKKVVPLKHITEISQTMSSVKVRYTEANSPKSTKLKCKDDAMAEDMLDTLQKRLGSRFKRTSTPVSRGLIATMSSIVMTVFLGITTFFYYAAVEATTGSLVSTGSARTRGMAAWLGLLGPNGVACIGGALFLLILIIIIAYLVNPPLTTTLAPKKTSSKRSKK